MHTNTSEPSTRSASQKAPCLPLKALAMAFLLKRHHSMAEEHSCKPLSRKERGKHWTWTWTGMGILHWPDLV